MDKSRSTLAEVAAAAGVSVATVSKVLNGRGDVAPSTRRRVRAQLDDADYRPVNRPARTEGVVEVAFPTWQNAYMVTVLDGITAAARAEGFEVTIGPPVQDDQVELDLNRLRTSGRVGAILITVDASLEPIKVLVEGGFPVVVV